MLGISDASERPDRTMRFMNMVCTAGGTSPPRSAVITSALVSGSRHTLLSR